MYQCSLTPGSSRFVTECTNPSRGVVRAPRYEQDPYVLYTVNAVYAGECAQEVETYRNRHSTFTLVSLRAKDEVPTP